MVKKLHIPAPGEKPDDPYGIDGMLFYPLMICMALAGLGFVYLLQQEPSSAKASGAPMSEEAFQATSAHAAEERFGSLERAALEAHEWTEEEIVLVVEHGPRLAAEVVCEGLTSALEAGAVDEKVRDTMVRAVDSRATETAWSCLSRLHWDDRLGEDEPIAQALEAFWQEAERFESLESSVATIVASTIDDFRERRRRPESEPFYRWLRRCGMRLDYGASGSCQRLLRQIAPAQGEDFLLMIDRHLEKEGLETVELLDAVTAIGHVAVHGQPTRWKIEETRGLPAYDFDARVGAIFMLCRLVNSPDDAVSRAAARRLSQTGAVAARATDPHLVFRWRAGCRIGFGPQGADPYTAVPILGVWTGKEGDAPQYALRDAVERGECEEREGVPIWTCGTRRYNGKGRTLQQYLSELFTETRYIEWAEW